MCAMHTYFSKVMYTKMVILCLLVECSPYPILGHKMLELSRFAARHLVNQLDNEAPEGNTEKNTSLLEEEKIRNVRSPLPLNIDTKFNDGIIVPNFDLTHERKERVESEDLSSVISGEMRRISNLIQENNVHLVYTNISSTCDQVFNLRGVVQDAHLTTEYLAENHIRYDCFSGLFYRFLLLPYLEQLSEGLGEFDSDSDINSRLFSTKSQLDYVKNVMKINDYAELGAPVRDGYAIQFMLESITQGRHIRLEQKYNHQETLNGFARMSGSFKQLKLNLIIITVGAWLFYLYVLGQCCCNCRGSGNGGPSPCQKCCGRSIFRCITSVDNDTLGRIREEAELARPLRQPRV